MSIVEPVHDLVARAEIADLICLSCHAFDRGRWALYDRVFDPDAVCRTANDWRPWRDHIAGLQREAAALTTSHHQLGASLITLDGDRATAESYVSVYARVRANAPPESAFPTRPAEYCLFGGGRLIDSFVRRDGDWRITRRQHTAEWRDEQAINDAGLSAVDPRFRGLDGGDDATLPLVAQWL